jgi:hypothetical protein
MMNAERRTMLRELLKMLGTLTDEQVIGAILVGFDKEAETYLAQNAPEDDLATVLACALGAGLMAGIDMCNAIGLERMTRIQAMIETKLTP